MAHGKVPATKENLLTAIRESWNHFDKEYYFELVKSMPERIKVVKKAQRGETNTIFCQWIPFFPNIGFFHNSLQSVARWKII